MLARTVEIGRRSTPDEVLADLEADLAARPPLAGERGSCARNVSFSDGLHVALAELTGSPIEVV